MSNYLEFNDVTAFHPGYYIKEIIEEEGISQKDFAIRLGTTPKNLSLLIRGEQRLSIDIAVKLSRMLGTSIALWLNMQQAYDEKLAERYSFEELKKERQMFEKIDYAFFRHNYGLPDLHGNIDEQIKSVREFLSVSSLTILERQEGEAGLRSYSKKLTKSSIISTNIMIQIAVNIAMETECPKYNKRKFEKAVSFALSQTKDHDGFLKNVWESFKEAGVVLVILPEMKDSAITGATKRLNGKMLLMINGCSQYADLLWFILLREAGRILNGNPGISYKDEKGDEAYRYAENVLVPDVEYERLVSDHKVFDEDTIRDFAKMIDRDPGIVFGRLQKDGKRFSAEKDIAKKLRYIVEAELPIKPDIRGFRKSLVSSEI